MTSRIQSSSHCLRLSILCPVDHCVWCVDSWVGESIELSVRYIRTNVVRRTDRGDDEVCESVPACDRSEFTARVLGYFLVATTSVVST